MTHQTQPINLAIRSNVQTEGRLASLRWYAQNSMDRLNVENINPRYNGRTIPYHAVDNDGVVGIMEQLAVVMDWTVHDQLHASEDVKLESLMINRWSEGDALGLHADNAYWEPGSPNHLKPNYSSWRTHAAVYYINDDYEGGNLYFVNGVEIIPKMDTIIAFSGGLDAVHGVKPITAGTRWTVTAWFTDDPEHYHSLAQPWDLPKNESVVNQLRQYG